MSAGPVLAPEGLMTRPLWTTDEIGRTCERIERNLDAVSEKVDEQGETIAGLAAKMEVFESHRHSSFKPVVTGGAAGGAIMTAIEIIRQMWK